MVCGGCRHETRPVGGERKCRIVYRCDVAGRQQHLSQTCVRSAQNSGVRLLDAIITSCALIEPAYKPMGPAARLLADELYEYSGASRTNVVRPLRPVAYASKAPINRYSFNSCKSLLPERNCAAKSTFASQTSATCDPAVVTSSHVWTGAPGDGRKVDGASPLR